MRDSRTKLGNGHYFHGFNPTGESYDSWGSITFDARSWGTAENYESNRAENDGEFLFSRKNEDDDPSGVCSPPLWKTSPSRNPVQSCRHRSNYLSLSPTARTQAIARGQWELMEMVKNMPETCYELSLKDIVENPRVLEAEEEEECLVPENISGKENRSGKLIRRKESGKSEKKTKLVRSGSIDHNGGLFLKMVFPVSYGGSKQKKKKKKKKKQVGTNGAISGVSPKPENWERSSKGSVEKEWWKMMRFSASSESEGGFTSSNSGGSRSNSNRYQ